MDEVDSRANRRIYADFHSHLVPAVDDGAKDLADSLEGVNRMVGQGIEKIITTPHFDASLTLDPPAFEARMEEMDDGWKLASHGVTLDFPDIDFRRGFEIKLDVPDPDLSDDRLRLGGTGFCLVEWPRMQVPPRSSRVIERIQSMGLRPVIAHPERYFGVDRGLLVIGGWKRAGALLQVNYGSLVGRYGPHTRAVAMRLLTLGWVDYLCTDFHGREHLKLYKAEGCLALEEMGGEEQLELLGSINTLRLFDDEPPLAAPPLPVDRGFWGRVREIFRTTGDGQASEGAR